MGNKKIWYIIILLLLLSIFIIIITTYKHYEPGVQIVEHTDLDYNSVGTDNSPESLAKQSTLLLKNYLNGQMTPKDLITKLESIACTTSVTEMKKNYEVYYTQLKDYQKSIKQLNDGIDYNEYAKTVYNGDGTAYILRIQHNKNGGQYYFKQDFILENNVWKVRGDNITNKFQFK